MSLHPSSGCVVLCFFSVIQPKACGAEATAELGLLLDSSGSVTIEDFAARSHGLAAAFRNEWLQQAIDSSTRSLAVGVYQFSGPAQVSESVPWVVVSNSSSATSFAATLQSMNRDFAGGSDLDSALLISSIFTANNAIDSENTTFLVLADGPTAANGIGRDAALDNGVDGISAWVTGDTQDLDGYLAGVIGGNGSVAIQLSDPAEFEALLGRQLFQFFQNPDNTSLAASSALGQAVLGGSRMAFDDINARLFRLRSGAPEGPSTAWRFKQETGSKGIIEPVNPPVTWNVFGSAGGGRQHGDARHGSVYGIPVLNQAAYDLDFATASAGVEAAFEGDWFLGAALLGYSGDVDLNGLGDGDDRALGGAVYLSHHRSLPHRFTAYGDVMAGWLDHDIDLDRRVTGGTARGDTDAMVSIIEMNLGLRREDYGILHGPAFGIDMIRGEMNGFREKGAATALHRDIDFSSTLMTIGYHGTVRIDAGGIPLILMAGTAWEHEFEDSSVAPSGSEIGSLAEDAWLIEIGARVALSDRAFLHAGFENRLASEADSQFFKLGCEIKF